MKTEMELLREWLDEELDVIEARFDSVQEHLITALGRLDHLVTQVERIAAWGPGRGEL